MLIVIILDKTVEYVLLQNGFSSEIHSHNSKKIIRNKKKTDKKTYQSFSICAFIGCPWEADKSAAGLVEQLAAVAAETAAH